MSDAQQRWIRGMERGLARWRAAGAPRGGWKIGINVPEIQARLGLAHPLVGPIDADRVVASGARLAPDPAARWHVEPELAIRLARRVDPSADPPAALGCVAAIAPALEIVDYALPSPDLEAVIEHSMFHAGCVLGASRPASDASELGTRWPRLQVGDASAPAPRADLVPASIGALLHFAAELLARFGEALEAGDLLLGGSYTDRAVALPPHGEARADFGPLGVVSVEVG